MKRVIGEILKPSGAWLTCVICGEHVDLARPKDREPDDLTMLEGACPGCRRNYRLQRQAVGD